MRRRCLSRCNTICENRPGREERQWRPWRQYLMYTILFQTNMSKLSSFPSRLFPCTDEEMSQGVYEGHIWDANAVIGRKVFWAKWREI